jgi:hypothetical protein
MVRECRASARQRGLLVVEDALFVAIVLGKKRTEQRDQVQSMLAAA